MNWTETVERYLREGRTVSGGKGGDSQQEQAQANQISQQQLDLQKQQLGMQQTQLNSVNSVADPMIANGGMSQAQEAALNSLALNQSGQQLNQSIGQVGQNLQARGVTGGPFAGGGTAAQNYGGLYAMQNSLTQNSLSNVQLQKAAQLQGLLGLKMGIGSQYGANATSAGNQGVNALGSAVTAAGNADQAQSQFMGSLVGALTSPFSITGKIGGGCWVARAVYGEGDPIWMAARDNFRVKSASDWKYRVLWRLYQTFGPMAAEVVKRNQLSRRIAQRFFDGLIYG